jgi:hypothetical protein
MWSVLQTLHSSFARVNELITSEIAAEGAMRRVNRDRKMLMALHQLLLVLVL